MSHMFNNNSSYSASPMDVKKVSDDLSKYKKIVDFDDKKNNH
jgi:hypothetical protein